MRQRLESKMIWTDVDARKVDFEDTEMNILGKGEE
jgi:hypothetical protein